jgi:hypothetical protein
MSLILRAERLIGLHIRQRCTRVRTCPRRMDTLCPLWCSWGQTRGIVFAAASVYKTAEIVPPLFPVWLSPCMPWEA